MRALFAPGMQWPTAGLAYTCSWESWLKHSKDWESGNVRGLVYVSSRGCCSLQTDAINTQTLALACFVSKTLQSHTKLGRSLYLLIFCEDSKKLICNPDTNKQLMHKYAHNFKTKGEQLYLRCKGGISFLIKAAQGKIKESKSSPRVCSVCVCSCMPAPGRSLSFSCLPLVTLPVALAVAGCQPSTLRHPSIHPSIRIPRGVCINQTYLKEVLLYVVLPCISFRADVAYSGVASILLCWNCKANQ